jgi:putative ABC transport system permease protein
MKRTMMLLLIITIALTNILAVLLFNNEQFINRIFNKTSIRINYDKSEVDFNIDTFLEELKEFSSNNNISVSMYEYLGDTEVNIYAANILLEDGAKLKKGTYPDSYEYISNIDNKDIKQSGILFFPITNWTIKIYNISQVKNVGLGDQIYFSSVSEEVLDAFISRFSEYGELKIEKADVSSLQLLNISLVLMVSLMYAASFVGILIYCIINRKKMILLELWGYSKFRIYKQVLKNFTYSYMIFLVIQSILMIAAFLCTGGTASLNSYMGLYILINIVIFILLLSFIMIACSIVLFFGNLNQGLKGKSIFQKVNTGTIMLRVLIMTLLFILLNISVLDFTIMNRKMNNYTFWNKTEDIYTIGMRTTNMENMELGDEREISERLEQFYKEVEKKKQAFIIEAENYRVLNHNHKRSYVYEKLVSEDKYEISPYGKSIMVNRNYLKINPIVDEKNTNVLDKLIWNDNTLNILVPEDLKKREAEIQQSFKEYFYFQKVTVENIYNEDIGLPMNNQSIDSLFINIIYTQQNQKYFTYDSQKGDFENQIEDPIAMIYSDGFDQSVLMSLIFTSLYFEDTSKGEAYLGLEEIITSTKSPEVKFAESVYGMGDRELLLYKEKFLQSLLTILIVLILSITLYIICIWSYYKSRIKELNLKYIFGYSYFIKYKYLLILTILISLFVGMATFVFYKNIVTLIIIPLIIFLDLILLKIFDNYMVKHSMTNLKGEY